jgi:hypothetical protein
MYVTLSASSAAPRFTRDSIVPTDKFWNRNGLFE